MLLQTFDNNEARSIAGTLDLSSCAANRGPARVGGLIWRSCAAAVRAMSDPATCLPDHCFCEAIGSGLVAQPANAWSSLAFVLAGLWIAFAPTASSGKDKFRNRMVSEPAYRRLYGCALTAIGLGSYYYHASLSFAGQVCDMSGMYLLITFALLYGVARRNRIRTSVAMATYIVWNAALLVFQMAFPDLRRYVFALLVVGVLAIEARYRMKVGGNDRTPVVNSRGGYPRIGISGLGAGHYKSCVLPGECVTRACALAHAGRAGGMVPVPILCI